MIRDQIRIQAQEDPLKTALIVEGAAISYGELDEQIELVSHFLHHSKKKTFLFQASAFQNICGVLACNAIGKSGIVIPFDFDQEQKENLLGIHDAEIIDSSSFGLKYAEGVFKDGEKGDSPFLGILTSGSTGEAKVVWKTNENWEAAFAHQSEIFRITSKDRVFVVDALAYSANLNAVAHALWLGATVVLGQFAQSRVWFEQWKSNAVSAAFLVPSHCRLLARWPSQYPALKSLVTAGEKLDINTALFLIEKFPKACLTEYYGAAELGHISYHQNREILDMPISVGKAFPEVEIEISGGEIKVQSPYVSKDFKEEATVNDLGYFEDDRLILLGRSGRVFNRRGVNVFAQEIENVALGNGLIRDAVLVSSADSREIHKLTLFYSPKQENKVSESELRKLMADKLPKSKIPNFFRELKVIPHSDAGKVDFKALSKMCDECEQGPASRGLVH